MVILDLDGTTIPHLYDLGQYTAKVFKKLNEEGHKVVIATGRPFRSSYFVYYKMNLDTPLINYNGCLITNPKDPSFKQISFLMDRSEMLSIYNNCKDMYTLFFVESYDEIYSNYDQEDVHELMHLNPMSNLIIGDLNDILDKGCHGSLVLAKEGCGELMVNYVNSNYKGIAARLWSWSKYKEIVELYSTEVNKGTAIKKVMSDLGFKKDDVICCGDSVNDIEIFNESGFRVCPANADPRLKKYASVVLENDCKSEAIADYFNERFNLGVKR